MGWEAPCFVSPDEKKKKNRNFNFVKYLQDPNAIIQQE